MSRNPTPPPARPWSCRMRRLTPDEVLDHLRAFCRDEMGVSEERARCGVVPDAPLERLTELGVDRLGLDSYDWEGFGPYFGLDLDHDWWDRWRRDATIADLCADLAGRIEVPVFEPITLLGRVCETAGAFSTIRRMFAADGADVRRLGPSSPLAPYLARHPDVFQKLRLASGGRLPALVPDSPLVVAGCWLFLLAGLTALFTWGLNSVGVTWPGSLFFALVGAGTLALGLAVYSRRVTRHTLRLTDFRQLVYALLGRPPQRTANTDSLS